MKKIMNGKMYNTDSATLLASASSIRCDQADSFDESLYRKKTGEFFIYGYGGPWTCWAKSNGMGGYSSGEGILPVSEDEAREWAEKHLTADEYEKIFGVIDENKELMPLQILLPKILHEELKAHAEKNNTTMKDIIVSLLKENIR